MTSSRGRMVHRRSPLVTVGVPVFNGEKYLRPMLESLIDQTLCDVEILVGDNASTDGTAGICTDLARLDPRIRYIRHEENLGLVKNWNFLARQARGAYFKWASASDICEKSTLALCTEALERDPNSVLCFGRTTLVDESEAIISEYDRDFAVEQDRPSERWVHILRNLGLNHPVWGVIRHAVLMETGLIRAYQGGDLVLVAELALRGKFLLRPERLLRRRIAKGTWSGFLSETELRQFLTPGRDRKFHFDMINKHWDYFRAILRASIPAAEKARAIIESSRRLYWDLLKAMQSSRA